MAAVFPVVLPPVLNPFGEDAVQRSLQICGCSLALRNSIVSEGVTTMDTLRRLSNHSLDNMAKRITSLPANRGGARFGEIYLSRVKALCLWAKERHLMNQEIDGNIFSRLILDDSLDKLELAQGLDETSEAIKPESPEKLKPIEWVPWKRSFWNWLSSIKATSNIPLTYVIRKSGIDLATYTFADQEERRLYMIGLTGPKYMSDRTKVYQLLKGLMVDTDGWTWMQQFDRAQDGRRAWQALCAHYDGPGETQKRIMQARASISELYYKSEASFSFEKFTTKLREAYAVMEDNEEPVLPQTQVRDMCDRITCDHTAVVTAVVQVRTGTDRAGIQYKDSFTSAANHISEIISQTFPKIQAKGFNRRQRVASVGGNGRGPGRGRGSGRSPGRGRGRGGRWNGGRGRGGSRFHNNYYGPGRGSPRSGAQLCNGVDISDLTRWYTEEELSRLTNEVRQDIWKAKHDRDNKRSSNVSTVVSAEKEETPTKLPETGGQNGMNFGSGAYSTSTITTPAAKRAKH
jgi:hypothetical protein